MPFDPISYVEALKSRRLSNLIIDVNKDWDNKLIKNLGEPIDPNDATRKIYVDVATTGLGINYYLLDEADSEVTAYKKLSITPPELSEVYVEVTQNSAGDYEIASWIAPSDGISILKLGVYTLHFQAEKISGNIDVRLFFRLYERDTGGGETLIAESYLSDFITDRKNIVIGLVLAHDYEMAEGSRLVLKIYAHYSSSGSNTTIRLYYQGAIRSRLAIPIAKEILDTLYAQRLHASQHGKGGEDELSLDASQITSGVLDVARIPDLSRSKITDFFSSPFWDNIPDKPSVFPSELSQITIDTNKDWGGYQITNVGKLAIGATGFTSEDEKLRVNGKIVASSYIIEGYGNGGVALTHNDGYGNANVVFNHVAGVPEQDGNAARIVVNTDSTTGANIEFQVKSGVTAGIAVTLTKVLRLYETYAQFLVDIQPDSDNTRNIGTSSKRFANLYAVNVYTGDLCFEEKVCEVCGQPFKEDDEIVLKVKKVDDHVRTVPIHLKCSQAYKELDERLRKLEGGD